MTGVVSETTEPSVSVTSSAIVYRSAGTPAVFQVPSTPFTIRCRPPFVREMAALPSTTPARFRATKA